MIFVSIRIVLAIQKFESCLYSPLTLTAACDNIYPVDAGIAQSVEHFTRNEGVVCSSHITSSIKPALQCKAGFLRGNP